MGTPLQCSLRLLPEAKLGGRKLHELEAAWGNNNELVSSFWWETAPCSSPPGTSLMRPPRLGKKKEPDFFLPSTNFDFSASQPSYLRFLIGPYLSTAEGIIHGIVFCQVIYCCHQIKGGTKFIRKLGK